MRFPIWARSQLGLGTPFEDADSWHQGPGLPVAMLGFGTIAIGSFVFVLGGFSASAGVQGAVLRTQLQSGGGFSAWTSVSTLPDVTCLGAPVYYNGRLYLLGGAHGPDFDRVNTVYMATVDPTTGAVGSWTTSAVLPVALSTTCAGVIAGQLWIAGYSTGNNSTLAASTGVYRADISLVDGTLSNFTLITPSAPFEDTEYCQVGAVVGNRLVKKNGATGQIAWADVSAGSLGSWTTQSVPWDGVSFVSVSALGSRLYVMGGYGPSPDFTESSSIWRADSGTAGLGAFTLSRRNPLPLALDGFGTALVGRNALIIGGEDANVVERAETYFIRLPASDP